MRQFILISLFPIIDHVTYCLKFVLSSVQVTLVLLFIQGGVGWHSLFTRTACAGLFFSWLARLVCLKWLYPQEQVCYQTDELFISFYHSRWHHEEARCCMAGNVSECTFFVYM